MYIKKRKKTYQKKRIKKIEEKLTNLTNEEFKTLLKEADCHFFFEYYNNLSINTRKKLEELCTERLVKGFKNKTTHSYDVIKSLEDYLKI